YDVYVAEDIGGAVSVLERETVDLLLTDLRLAGEDGMQLIERALKMPHPPICIMMTAYGSVDTAVEAMKRGAYDFVTKPLNLDKVEMLIARALQSRRTEQENRILRQQIDERFGLENILGESLALREVLDTIRQVAPSAAKVLLEGESGTGKELAAHAIHNLSRRNQAKFVVVHCAALSPTLLESELFGHEKGAFTGAVAQRIGRFEQANGGTIFLDEIGEMSPKLQAKLLQVTQDGRFQRVGSNTEIHTNARILAATNRNMEDEVKQGRFREDLFYRLNVVELNIPPLRERPEDILPLAGSFIAEFTQGRARFSSSVADCLLRYSWPGNVRELRNAMERAALLSRGELILPEHLPSRARAVTHPSTVAEPMDPQRLEEIERHAIIQALLKHSFNRTETAKALGISRRTLIYKLQRLRELGYEIGPVPGRPEDAEP